MTKKQQLLELLELHYNFKTLRPGQEQAIDNVLANKSTVVIMPTGGGKSLCYQLPSLVLDGVTIVVSPLISLMKDQVDSLSKIGIPATYINSSLSPEQVSQALNKIKNNYYKLVYIAPERFYSHEFINTLNEIKVSLFAIDEAHCISQWGHDFRPSYTRLAKAIESLGNPPIIALTATATIEVKKDIVKQLNLTNPEYIITGFARPNLSFSIIQARDSQKNQLILDLIWKTPQGSGIIYAGTRKKVEELLVILEQANISAVGYHAGKEPETRSKIQENFMSGKTKIVVATNAFGMGIDKSDIRFVVHYSLPGTLEAYYQEVGRAGRDGLESNCLLFFNPRDRILHEFFIKGDNPPTSAIEELYTSLISQNSDTILATYAELKKEITDEIPEMAIGTSLKLLEKQGYIKRASEKSSNAHFKLNTNLSDAINKLGARAKKSISVISSLQSNFGIELSNGIEIDYYTVPNKLGITKDALTRVLKKLSELNIAEYTPPFRGTEIHILKRIDPSELDLDHDALKTKLTQAYSKLDKIEDFIFSLNCRQKYILEYFGDNNSYTCGKCDNCLSINTGSLYYQPKPKKQYNNHNQDSDLPTIRLSKPQDLLSTKLTQLQTLELWQDGQKVDEIAQERDLKPSTIITHICYLVEKKLIKPSEITQILPNHRKQKILKTIEKVGPDVLTPIKSDLPNDFTWDEIKLTISIRNLSEKK